MDSTLPDLFGTLPLIFREESNAIAQLNELLFWRPTVIIEAVKLKPEMKWKSQSVSY